MRSFIASRRTNRGSLGRALLGGAATLAIASTAMAGPRGEKVVRGDVNFTRRGHMTLIEASNNSIINYSSFDILSHESVQFMQPGSNARVLNRIQSQLPTTIDGSLMANGIVYLVNPAGVIFGQGAVIDTAGLFAAAGNISDDDFLSNINHFTDLSGSVINHGVITSHVTHLIGQQVGNHGTIETTNGMVSLVAGEDVIITEQGEPIHVRIDGGAAQLQEGIGVENTGTISNIGGSVELGAGDVYSLAIKNTGIIKADRIVAKAAEGAGNVVHIEGTLDASNYSERGKGGVVEILGDKIAVYDATIDASGTRGGGEILVGGDFQGSGDVQNAKRTYVSGDAWLQADAILKGKGGKIIVWSDEITSFAGHVQARGGELRGRGGFAEVSGKEQLGFSGTADLYSVKRSKVGTLLLDPRDITIVDANGGANDGELIDETVLFGDGGAADFTLSENVIELATGNVIFQANRDIILDDLTTDGVLDFGNLSGGNSVTFQAGRHITFVDTNDVISTNGADLHLEANSFHSSNFNTVGTLTLGGISTGGGDVTMFGNNFIINTAITTGGGDIIISAGRDNIPIALDDALAVLLDSEFDLMDPGAGTIIVGEATTAGDNGAFTTNQQTFTANDFTVDDLTLDAKNFTLITSSRINDTDAVGSAITTSGILTLDAGGTIGDVTADGFAFDATTLSVSNPGNAVRLTDVGAGDTNVLFGRTGQVILFDKAAGNLDITDWIAGGSVDIDVTGGDITLDDGGLTAGAIDLNAGGAINGNAGIADTAEITSSGAITLTSVTGIGGAGGSLEIDSQGNTVDVNVTGVGDATVRNITTSLHGVTGSHTGTGNIDYTGAGNLNVNGISSSGGDVSVSSVQGSVQVQAQIDTSAGNGNINLTNEQAGDDLFLADVADLLNAGSGDVTIDVTGGVINSLSGTNSDITTTGTANIFARGTGTTGSDALDVNVADLVIVDRSGGTESIAINETAESITSTTITQQDVNIGDIDITYFDGDAIDINGDVADHVFAASSLSDGDFTFIGQGGAISQTGGLNFAGSGDNTFTANAGQSITLDDATNVFGDLTATGGAMDIASGGALAIDLITSDSTVNLESTGGITLNAGAAVTANGATTIDADTDNDGGAFTISAGGSVDSTDNTIDITASDLVLGGTVDAGTAATSITSSDGGTIGVGNTAGGMSIDGTDLANITASDLTIETTGNMTVDGINAGADLANIAGPVTLNATGAASSVTFATGASTFGDLNVNAGEGINVDIGLTADALALESDSDTSGSGDADINAAVVTTSFSSVGFDFDNTGGTIDGGGSALTINHTGTSTVGAAITNAGTTDITSTAGINLAADITTVNADLNLNSAVTMTGSSILSTSAGAGNITFASTVDGAGNLTANAGTGNVDSSAGAIGGTVALSNVDFDGDTISLGNVTTTGSQEYAGASGITLNSDYTSTGTGTIAFNGAVTIGSDTNVTTAGAAFDDITFSDTVDGAFALTADAGAAGNVDAQGDIGGTTALTSVDLTGAMVDVANVTTTGAQTYTGATNLNSTTYSSTTAGAILLDGAVTLGDDATITTAGGAGDDITFTSTVDGAFTLAADAGAGNVDAQGDIGGTTPLTSVDFDGATIDVADVTTTGAQDYTGAINLNGDTYSSTTAGAMTFDGAVTLGDNATITTAGGAGDDITFTDTVDGAFSLTANAGASGAVDAQGAIGGTTPLTSVDFDGDTISVADVTTTGAQDYTGVSGITLNSAYTSTTAGPIAFNGAVTLGSDTTVTTAGGAGDDITFTDTVDGAFALTADAGAAGNVDAQGNIGGTTALTSVDLTGAMLDVADVSTTGAQTYTGAVNLNSTTYSSSTAGAILLDGAVTLGDDATITTAGGAGDDITFASTIDGAFTLTANAGAAGNVDAQGDIGGTTPLSAVDFDGAIIDVANVTTTGAQDYTGAINLNGDTYSSTTAGAMNFDGAVTLGDNTTITSAGGAGDDITFTNTVDGAFSLTANAGASGNVDAQGNIGETTAVASIDFDGDTISVLDATTTGSQDYAGTTSITVDGDYASTTAGLLIFNGPVTLAGDTSATTAGGAGDDITFGGFVDGGFALSADAGAAGIVDAQSDIGATTELSSILFEGGTVNVSIANTSGAQTYTATTINATGDLTSSAVGDITLDGNTNVLGDMTITTAGDNDDDVIFTGTIDGSQSLAANAGAGIVDVQGAIGGTTALTFVDFTGGDINLTDVTTVGDQTYTGSGTINLASTYASTGPGAITFDGDVVLGSNTTVTTGGAAGDDITFNGTVDGGFDLVGDAGASGDIIANGLIGDTTPLASIDFDGFDITVCGATTTGLQDYTALGTLTLGGDFTRTTAGVFNFNGPLVLKSDMTITTGGAVGDDVNFSSTVDGTTAGTESLTVNAGAGDVNASGAIGGTTALDAVDFTGTNIDVLDVTTASGQRYDGDDITINGTYTNTGAGAIVFSGATTLGGDSTVMTAGGAGDDINFNEIDGPHTLTVNGGVNGDVNVDLAIGATTALTSIDFDAFNINLVDVTTTGAQDYTGTGTIRTDGTISNTGAGAIAFNGNVGMAGDTTVNSAGAVGDDITFGGTVDGAFNLIANAGGGDVTGTGIIGGTTAVTSVDFDGENITVVGATSTGSQAYDGATAVNIGGDFASTGAGTIDFNGPTTLTADSTVTSAGAAGDDIGFSDTIDGAFALDLDGGAAGNVALGGTVGGTTALSSLTVDGGDVTLADVTTTGDQTYDSSSTLSLANTFTSTGAGDITFNGDVILAGATTVDTGGTAAFNGTIDGTTAETEDLTINLNNTGALNLAGAVGQATRVGTLTVADGDAVTFDVDVNAGGVDVTANDVTVNGTIDTTAGGSTFTVASTLDASAGSLTSTGDITQVGAGVVTLGSDVTAGGDASFDGVVTLTGGDINAGGDATFNDDATLTGDVIAGNDATFNGVANLSGEVTAGNDATFNGDASLGGDVTAGNDATFNGAVTLAGDRTITGSNVAFNSTVDSDATARSLNVNTTGGGTTTFGGDVGGTAALSSLTTNADGTTNLGAGITTTNGTRINDALTLTGTSSITDTGTNGITVGTVDGPFGFTLTSSSDVTVGDVGATTRLGSLAIQTGTTDNDTILFTGTEVNTSGDISLNAAGRAAVPLVATMGANNALTLDTSAGNFTMGQNEKLTTTGDLSILASAGTATLGDLTSGGAMNVNANSITALLRDASLITASDGGAAQDNGLDFVSGGGMTFTYASSTLSGTGAGPFFGNPNATVGGTGSFGAAAQSRTVRATELKLGQQFLDLKAEGPTSTNVANVIAGAVPRESQSGNVGEDTSIGMAQREVLQRMGIFARDASRDELIDFLIGRAIYNDLPESETFQGQNEVAVPRLSAELVDRLVSLYDATYFRSEIDPATGEEVRVARDAEIKSQFSDAYQTYMLRRAAGTPTATGFADFLRTDPAAGEALIVAESLSELMQVLNRIGLTPVEFEGAQYTLLSSITPESMPSWEMLADAVSSIGGSGM